MTNLFENQYVKLCEDILNNEKYKSDYKLLYKIGVLYDLYKVTNPKIKVKNLDGKDILLKDLLKNRIVELKNNIDNGIIKKLLEIAFIFANFDTEEILRNVIVKDKDEYENIIEKLDNFKNHAYRIAISVYYYGKFLEEIGENNNSFFQNNNIIYMLFTRLGIITDARDNLIEDVDVFSLNFHSKLEAVNKELNNRFSIKEEIMGKISATILRDIDKEFVNNLIEEEIYFSDFQREVMDNLLYKKDDYIISAPTSAGKTFILKNYIVYRFIESTIKKEKINIAFIVPSKALVNELQLDFVDLFNKFNLKDKVSIYTYLSDVEKIVDDKNSNLLILTPERLHYFYGKMGNSLKLNLLVVDEAHKIGNGYRGVLLSHTIRETKKINKKCRIILLAPLLRKLNRFKDEFEFENINFDFSNFFLVGKNEIFIDKVKENNRVGIKILVKIDEDKEELIKFIENPNFDNQKQYLSNLSYFFTSGKYQSIIFRINPGKNDGAESLAEGIYNNLGENYYISDEILGDLKNLQKYLEDIFGNYGREMTLYKTIIKGVAYHNGKLPPIIKLKIEEFYKDGKIKYLCSNNSILEGVNLPVKNIFVGGDGKDNRISNLDLKNLVGRAGRLNYHLSGNIFYIDYKKYVDKLKNQTEELQNSVENIIGEESKFDRFLQYIKPGSEEYKYFIDEKNKEKQDFEYLFGYLVSLALDKGIDEAINYIESIIGKLNLKQKAKLREGIDNIYKDIIEHKNYDSEIINIFKKYIFVDVRKQINFLENIRNGNNRFVIKEIENYSENWIQRKGSKNKLFLLFNDINKNLFVIKDYIYGLKSNEIPKGLLSDELLNEGSIKKDKNKELLKFIKKNGNKIFYRFILKDDLYVYIKGGTIKIENGRKIKKKSLLNVILSLFWDWINSKSISYIYSKFGPKNISKNLDIINQYFQFYFVNIFSLYFKLANVGYKLYLQEHYPEEYENMLQIGKFPQFDEKFIYYTELGTYFPTLIYLVSKGVSRETAIWLCQKGYIKDLYLNKPRDYFKQKRDGFLFKLGRENKIIKEELERFLYN